ncbi:endonuclease V-like isoform X2 [Dreissena polymorpha]|uniref:endonuclease V-like isoform X2 n=1 Tax=Dreissena polymorpha TaxID=45954 RepID=UPI0022655DC3|nr:endonuclease V-like isoform X2 [Dreissena polymorpha]
MAIYLYRLFRDLFYKFVIHPLGLIARPVSRAEQLLSEDIRLKWEREQTLLKEQMVLKDTEEIKCMLQVGQLQEDTCMSSNMQYYIAGVDISFVKGDDVTACAALVVLTFPKLEVVYSDCKMIELTKPYIPGFLGFREVPFLLELFNDLQQRRPELMPHLVMVDGNGILHPREFGSACHLGVCLGLPCIGVAKKLFHVDGLEKNVEHHEKIASLEKGGDTFPLVGSSGRVLGMALRSCSSSKNPIYVSPGHLVTMETATRLVHMCCKHRIPEPVRMADINSREYIRVRKQTDDGQG